MIHTQDRVEASSVLPPDQRALPLASAIPRECKCEKRPPGNGESPVSFYQ